MQNVIVQQVKRKVVIENDIHFDSKNTRIIAYVTIETKDGLVISDISVRQDIDNHSDIRIIFPFKRLHNEYVSYVSFVSDIVRKQIEIMIFNALISGIQATLKE